MKIGNAILVSYLLTFIRVVRLKFKGASVLSRQMYMLCTIQILASSLNAHLLSCYFIQHKEDSRSQLHKTRRTSCVRTKQ
jgi:hypothetical protein